MEVQKLNNRDGDAVIRIGNVAIRSDEISTIETKVRERTLDGHKILVIGVFVRLKNGREIVIWFPKENADDGVSKEMEQLMAAW